MPLHCYGRRDGKVSKGKPKRQVALPPFDLNWLLLSPVLLQDPSVQARRAFGFLFVCVSIAVGIASVISEVAYLNNLPPYYYPIIWLGSFGAVFGAGATRFREVAPMIRGRMKTSAKWSAGAKALNGICWAGPFAAIGAFPTLYQYLILLGIGLGNLSTWLLVKKYDNADNREQLIVAVISLVAIPVAVVIDSSLFAPHQDIAAMLSRILIALAYAAGGAFALLGRKAGPVVSDPNSG
jgi:hypothetical protein